MEGIIGEIRWFAGNFAPKTWAFCNAQTINIASNTALFSILGTTYGGNGSTTFMLPDFQGRVCIGANMGTSGGNGLSSYALGQKGGSDSVTLDTTQMPVHSHQAIVSVLANNTALASNSASPKNAFPSAMFGQSVSAPTETVNVNAYAPLSGTTVNLNPATASIGPSNSSGGNIPHNNQQPFIGMNYIICQFGVFPARN